MNFSHLDSSTLDFLRHTSGLFDAVNLDLYPLHTSKDLTKLRTILGHLTPLLHGIHSMRCFQSAIPLVQQFFCPELDQFKMLTIVRFRDWANINFCMDWLTSGMRDSAEPKFLKLEAYFYTTSEDFQQFSQALQQVLFKTKIKNPYFSAISLGQKSVLIRNSTHLSFPSP